MAIGIKSSLKTPSLICGILFAILGFKALSEPRFYFRGAYADFTGYNKEIGYSLIVLAIIFVLFSFYISKNKTDL